MIGRAGWCASLVVAVYASNIIDFERDAGAVADVAQGTTQWMNGRILNETLLRLRPGDRLVIPNKTFHLVGGIRADNVHSVVIQIDGTLSYSDDFKRWPRYGNGHNAQVLECFFGTNWSNVTFTSAGMGTMQGNGAKWWGLPGIGYLERQENRPRLIRLDDSQGLLFEHIVMLDSPYWTFWMKNVDGLEVRDCHIDVRRNGKDGHGIIDITAFNTDGFDVSGKNVWIHDSSIWNQDDCIAVKDGSENMLFERIEASGLGLTIGSIGSSTVRNITFRNIHMHHTYKGIYTKFRGGAGRILDVLYENIVIDEPSQYAIWIGPAQQSDSVNLCAAHPCSICWPQAPGAKCDAPAEALYRNITLRNVTVNNPKQSPGVLIANKANPMQDLIFENVRVNNPGKHPFGQNFKCEHAPGIALGDTWPIPTCFQSSTGRAMVV